MELILSIIVIAIFITLIYGSFQNSKKADMDRQSEAIVRLTKEAAEFEAKRILYLQFKDYINSLFVDRSNYKEKELKQILTRDFPTYKPINHPEFGSLFSDLLRADIIDENHTIPMNQDRYIKGEAFTDIRLNFLGIIDFINTDDNGTIVKYRISDDRYSKEAFKRNIISNDQNSTNTWRLKEYKFGISIGKKLKEKRRDFDIVLSDDKLYLFQDFEIIRSNNSSTTKIVIDEILDDKNRYEYKSLYDKGYKLISEMS